MRKENGIHEGKPWALVGYLSVLCIIPLIVKRDNAFTVFHAKQGLVLFISSLVFSIATFLPLIGILAALGNSIVLIFTIMGLFSVLAGKYWKIPVIGALAEQIDL